MKNLFVMMQMLWFVPFLRALQIKCTELAEKNLLTLQSNIDSMYAMLVHEFKQSGLMVKHELFVNICSGEPIPRVEYTEDEIKTW